MSENVIQSLRLRENSVFWGQRCPIISAVAFLTQPIKACHRELLILFSFSELWPYSIKPSNQCNKEQRNVSLLYALKSFKKRKQSTVYTSDIWKTCCTSHQNLEGLWSWTVDGEKKKTFSVVEVTFLLQIDDVSELCSGFLWNCFSQLFSSLVSSWGMEEK